MAPASKASAITNEQYVSEEANTAACSEVDHTDLRIRSSTNEPALPEPEARSRKNTSNVTPSYSLRLWGGVTTDNPLVGEVEPEQRPVRRQMYWLRDALRSGGAQSPRQCTCGRMRVAKNVKIVSQTGGASYRGIQACGSVWKCPVCQQKIKARRGTEVTKAVEWHGADRAFVLSLTIRHAMGHDLGTTRRALAKAWTATIRGAPWKRFCGAVGWQGAIRALEVTHGYQGWHPHLHIVILARDGWEDQERTRKEGRTVLAGRMPDGERADLWLFRRWCKMVREHLGASFVPQWGPGMHIARCKDARYLAKLGLEIAGIGKDANRGHRTPLQIARDWAVRRRTSDRRLWRAYCERMRGAHQIHWSHGLKKRAGIGEQTDQEIADGADEKPRDLITIGGVTWDEIRDLRWDSERDLMPKEGGEPAPLALLHEAEERGASGAAALVEKLILAAEYQAAQRALAAQKKRRKHDPQRSGRPPPQSTGPPRRVDR